MHIEAHEEVERFERTDDLCLVGNATRIAAVADERTHLAVAAEDLPQRRGWLFPVEGAQSANPGLLG